MRNFKCPDCPHKTSFIHKVQEPIHCVKCNSIMIEVTANDNLGEPFTNEGNSLFAKQICEAVGVDSTKFITELDIKVRINEPVEIVIHKWLGSKEGEKIIKLFKDK